MDVPAGTYYTGPVRWALESGVTTGTSSTTFAPNQADAGFNSLRSYLATTTSTTERTSVMETTEIERLNNQSKGLQVFSAVIRIAFGAAAIEITLRLASEYEGVTFGSLLLAAPLFTVGLLSLLCFWFVRMTAATNYLLAELLEASRQHNVASDSNSGPATSSNSGPATSSNSGPATSSNSGPATRQTALTQRPSVLERMVVLRMSRLTDQRARRSEKICAVTGCGRNSHSGHACAARISGWTDPRFSPASELHPSPKLSLSPCCLSGGLVHLPPADR